MPQRSLRGRMLVATPLIDEPTFHRTVVLLLGHDREGALGVVLNRPDGLDVADVAPPWAPLAAQPAVVFAGGPVGADTVICLGRAATGVGRGWKPVVGAVGMVDLAAEHHTAAQGVDDVRLYGGYAGWSSGQLEQEIASHAWLVVGAEAGDVFTPDPGGLWKRVLERQGGPAAWMVNFPRDPSMN